MFTERHSNEEIMAVKCYNCDAFLGPRDYGWCRAYEIFVDGETVCVRWSNQYTIQETD